MRRPDGMTVAAERPTADKLLADIESLSYMLDWSIRTTRRKHAAGLIPRPIRIAGAVRWRVSEIQEWVAVGCPDRRRWEALQRTQQQS
jgi:predicted DNA-binding transcriptional regulator AlpA